MPRTYVITGAASGIGAATADLLRERGHRVIGIDLHDADLLVDLTDPAARDAMPAQVAELSGGTIDAIIANAGIASPTPATVAVNYFGAVATLEGLRPLLAGSGAPRAVATISGASLGAGDEALLAAMREHDEGAALARAAEVAEVLPDNPIYSSSKRALAQWIRRTAPTPEWAGAGIPLNAIAPGFVETPLVADFLPTEQVQTTLASLSPLHGAASARETAYLLAWLTSEENTHLCGQVVFIDGGIDALSRGDAVW